MKRGTYKLIFFLLIFLLEPVYYYSNYCMAAPLKPLHQDKVQIAQNSFYAVLDIDKVVNHSVAYKEFKNKWSKINDKYQKEVEFYESQLLELEKKITKGIASKADTIQAKQKIGTYEVKVQKLLRKRKEVLEGAGSKAIEILRGNIDRLIYDYAKQNKVSIIFSKDQVIYFSNTVDITNFILGKLNNNLRKLEVDI